MKKELKELESGKEAVIEMLESLKENSSLCSENYEDNLAEFLSRIPIKSLKTVEKGKKCQSAITSAIEKCKDLDKAKCIIFDVVLDETGTIQDFIEMTNVLNSACAEDTRVIAHHYVDKDKKDEYEISIIYY